MKITPFPMCIAAVLLLSGCARMKVSSESDPKYNFGQIRTYQWVEAAGEIIEQEDTYLNKDLQKALNNELAARGWEQVLEAGTATVQVTYYIKIKEHQEYVESESQMESDFAGGVVFKKGQWNYEERSPEQQVYTSETGILHMMMSDAASGKQVWRGTLQARLDRSAPVEDQYELFQLAAHTLLKKLPAGSQ